MELLRSGGLSLLTIALVILAIKSFGRALEAFRVSQRFCQGFVGVL